MEKVSDFLVECGNPESFDSTVQQLGAAALIQNSTGDYLQIEGYHVMRVFGDPGFLKFAIQHQGYGKIIREYVSEKS